MINQRLFEHYGINTKKNLGMDKICPRPFDTVLIDKRGSCYACECTAWLPQSIGNLQIKSLREILEGDMRQHMQDSISDGTYRYCNSSQCSYLKSGMGFDTKSNVTHIRLAIDDSCNLRCPSCRSEMIFHKDGPAHRLGVRLADKINEWLHDNLEPIKVHIGSDGDPFASHVYRHFMSNTPNRSNTRYSILTNGLMLRDFHGNVPHIMSGLDTLGISIDGATRQTYEKLRLGGQWDKILDALECARYLKDKHHFELYLYNVLQKDNWHEMEQMLDIGHKYNVDRVYFSKIEDWNTGLDMSVHDFVDRAEFRELLEKVNKDPISRTYSII